MRAPPRQESRLVTDMECPSCSTALLNEARFCAHCGSAVSRRDEDRPDPLRELLKIALGRQYDVLRLLGKGGMGAVYLARENSLQRDVAIKVLPPNQQTSDESRERFRREARTAARLSHPNIVPLHTFGEVDGTLFFVMGFVKGESLAAKLRREGRLPVDESRRVLTEIAGALEYAHSLGIVHRDIKPDNVLMEEATGRAILTDFGVAKPLGAGETLTLQGSLLGTPHYMSPEQASGKSDIDHRSDLYSLGIMGYAMLAGRLPFEGKTTGELLVQHITKAPPTLRTLAPDVPVELSVALSRCLAKDPAERWYDAAAFRASLEPPEEEDLPAAFSDLREMAGSIALLFLIMTYALVWFFASGPDSDRPVVLLSLASVTLASPLILFAYKWRSLRKGGYEASRLVYETVKQPKPWISWYPRRLRIKGDVWDRLPPDLRRVRVSLGLFQAGFALILVPVFIAIFTVQKEGLEWIILPVVALVMVLPLLSAALLQLRWREHARAEGLYDAELDAQMTFLPTSASAFWSKPSVARMLRLTAESSDAARRDPVSSQEMLTAIGAIVSALDFPARELGERALMGARRLAASMEEVDREISALASSVEPAEAGRLTEKLDALGSGLGAAEGEVRSMLEQQLSLVRGLEARLEGAKSQRAHRAELLKTLWLQVLTLGAADGSGRGRETSDRIRMLSEEIGAHLAAEEQTIQRVGTSSTPDQPTIRMVGQDELPAQ